MIDTISKNISSMLVVVFLAAAPCSVLAAQADKTKVAESAAGYGGSGTVAFGRP